MRGSVTDLAPVTIREDQDASRFVYNGELFRIGQFRRGPKHPEFKGPHVSGGNLLVFPRTSVTITHTDKEPVIASPNVVMLYNDGQIYTRASLSHKGDLCDWFAFGAQTIADAILPFDESVNDRPDHPFQKPSGPSDARTYLMQRLVCQYVVENESPDQLYVEDLTLTILKQVIQSKYHERGIKPVHGKSLIERDVVSDIQRILLAEFDQNLSLSSIAQRVNYSPFHVSRLFRKHTGRSIHQYLKQIRLRISLEYLTQTPTDLTRLALTLGFSHHSHFTEAFRTTFGIPPSSVRGCTREQMHHFLSKISIA